MGDNLHFYPFDTEGTAYYRNFGDGTTGNDESPWHEYPLPASDYAIVLVEDLFSVAELKIYDVNGQVYDKDNLNSGEHTIDIKSLASGLYLVIVSDPEQTIYTGRLLVLHE